MYFLPNKYKQGFTLMELLVVVAIIAIIFIAVAMVARTSIERAKVAKAQADLNRLTKAIYILELDTGYMPNKELRENCSMTGRITGDPNEILFVEEDADFNNRSGIMENFGGTNAVPDWNGPYMDSIPLDPWGTPYEYDGDYNCKNGASGCEGHDNDATDDRVMYSRGPDKTLYTADDVILFLCTRGT